MTEQKAIEEFNLLKKSRMFIPRNDTVDLAIKALEKQILTEPIALDKDREYCKCPICDEYVVDYLGNRMAYCSNCGQALKWE